MQKKSKAIKRGAKGKLFALFFIVLTIAAFVTPTFAATTSVTNIAQVKGLENMLTNNFDVENEWNLARIDIGDNGVSKDDGSSWTANKAWNADEGGQYVDITRAHPGVRCYKPAGSRSMCCIEGMDFDLKEFTADELAVTPVYFCFYVPVQNDVEYVTIYADNYKNTGAKKHFYCDYVYHLDGFEMYVFELSGYDLDTDGGISDHASFYLRFGAEGQAAELTFDVDIAVYYGSPFLSWSQFANMNDKAYSKGYELGEDVGYANGERNGYAEAEKDWQTGYEEGITHGYEQGRADGYDDGYEKGTADGYQDGYDDGYQDDPENQADIMSGIIDGTWRSIKSAWDIFMSMELPFTSLSMGGIVGVAILVAVVAFIVKLVKG